LVLQIVVLRVEGLVLRMPPVERFAEPGEGVFEKAGIS